MWHRDKKWAHAARKMVSKGLLYAGYYKHSICKKKQYLWSAIKWDMSVNDNLTIEINNVCHGLQLIELK